MKRRAFIQSASATALGLLANAAGAQQKKSPAEIQPKVTPKVNPDVTKNLPTLSQTPAQQIISRMQQVADGGS